MKCKCCFYQRQFKKKKGYCSYQDSSPCCRSFHPISGYVDHEKSGDQARPRISSVIVYLDTAGGQRIGNLGAATLERHRINLVFSMIMNVSCRCVKLTISEQGDEHGPETKDYHLEM